MEHLKDRRTIRKYAARDVDEALLNELLELAERTQTMGNLQLYSVVITRDTAMKERLASAHLNQPMVTQAPVVLTVCADFNRTVRWAEQRQAVPGYDNFLSFMNAATDALLYAQTFCNVAESRGLGICYLGTTLYLPNQIIDVLELPRLVMPVATLTVGWPDECPAQTDRLPLPAVIHHERYADYTPERIDTYYTYKEGLPENRHFVEVNHKETLAQVFTDLRYTRADNECMSVCLLQTLQRQGFLE